MSEYNKEIVRKVNDALSNGNMEIVSEYVEENIMWNIVGMPVISGKKNFLETMKMMETEYCSGISINNIIAEDDYVVVESSVITFNYPVKSYNPSCCDIYKLRNGKIEKLTTYIIDITMNNEE